MYVLEYLAGKLTGGDPLTMEFRLLCSGVIYNGNVMTTDWTKSDVVRRILSKPFSLIATSRPIDEYPQELTLYITVPLITEKDGAVIVTSYPDEAIAQDLAAILSVLLRRLVSVSVKASLSTRKDDVIPHAENGVVPLPILSTADQVSWPRHPLGILRYGDGTIKVEDYNPRPKGVDAKQLAALLEQLPKAPHSSAWVSATRLYAQALPLLGRAPDIAYQLLISAIETIASSALRDYVPSRGDMVQIKGEVISLSKKLGLTEEQGADLAVAACAGNSWVSRKFRYFIMAMTDDSLWEPDELFQLATEFSPHRDEFEKTLKNIYNSRSSALHEGKEWQDTIRLGWGPMMPAKVLPLLLAGRFKVPPVVWFERVVNLALNRYLEPDAPEVLGRIVETHGC
jgi:hypothetical protein